MKVLNGLAFLVSLAVAVLAWLMYTFEPGLLLGTPWGSLHVAYVVVASFLLGAAVVGVYVLTAWVAYQNTLRRRNRELRQTQQELETLRNLPPQEPQVKVTPEP